MQAPCNAINPNHTRCVRCTTGRTWPPAPWRSTTAPSARRAPPASSRAFGARCGSGPGPARCGAACWWRFTGGGGRWSGGGRLAASSAPWIGRWGVVRVGVGQRGREEAGEQQLGSEGLKRVRRTRSSSSSSSSSHQQQLCAIAFECAGRRDCLWFCCATILRTVLFIICGLLCDTSIALLFLFSSRLCCVGGELLTHSYTPYSGTL